jgi:hypothetical protein
MLLPGKGSIENIRLRDGADKKGAKFKKVLEWIIVLSLK